MADEKEELDLGEEGGGSKKKLIIIIVAAVLLIGGGVGGWLFMSGDDSDSADGKKTTEEVEEASEVSEIALYHPLNPQFIVNLPPGSGVKMLQVEVQVQTFDQSVVDFLTLNEPMVRHHLLNLFSAQDGKALKETEGRKQLQKDVLDKIEELLKKHKNKGKINQVFFTQFVVQ